MSETNGYVKRDALFAVADRRYTDVEIDGLGKFKIQTLNDLEKSEYDAQAINKRGAFNRRAAVSANARLIVLCSVEPQFSADDVRRIQSLDAGAVEKLATACRVHCGFAEEPEKNSDTTDADDSPTD